MVVFSSSSVVIADADDTTLCFLFEVVLDMRRWRNLFEFARMLSTKRRRERDEREEDKKERSFILDDEDVEDEA
jgi:hypothetical protein